MAAPRLKAKAMIAVLPELIKQQAERDTYEVYIADALRIISENTAKVGGGSYMKARYADIVNPPPEEKRTPEEIIDRVKKAIEGG